MSEVIPRRISALDPTPRQDCPVCLHEPTMRYMFPTKRAEDIEPIAGRFQYCTSCGAEYVIEDGKLLPIVVMAQDGWLKVNGKFYRNADEFLRHYKEHGL